MTNVQACNSAPQAKNPNYAPDNKTQESQFHTLNCRFVDPSAYSLSVFAFFSPSSLRSFIFFFSITHTASLFLFILSPQVDLNNSEAHLIPATVTFSLGEQTKLERKIYSINYNFQ